MKKITNILLILVLIVGLFAFDSLDMFAKEANANEMSNTVANILTVNGSGTIKVKPDIAYINVGVETFQADAQLAQSKSTEDMNKVIAEIKKSGIDDKDIKTIEYNIYKTYKYEEPMDINQKETRTEGYQARNVVEVTVRDIENVGKIIDSASQSGANIINSIRFGLVDEESYYNEALKTAMANASSKATAILGTFGSKISSPYGIDEVSYSAPVLYREDMAKYNTAMDQASAPMVETGELDVVARIIVKYKY